MRSIILVCIFVLSFLTSAQARPTHRIYAVDPGCNVIFPCVGVSPSPRGERVVKAMGGFGGAKQVYTSSVSHHRAGVTIVAHPSGCPRSAFCGCGTSVRIFGHSKRELWLASNWFKFPRAAPAPGMVAVRNHHVFAIEQVLGGGKVLAYDANSGGHATRIHARSLAGYTIVNPHGGA